MASFVQLYREGGYVETIHQGQNLSKEDIGSSFDAFEAEIPEDTITLIGVVFQKKSKGFFFNRIEKTSIDVCFGNRRDVFCIYRYSDEIFLLLLEKIQNFIESISQNERVKKNRLCCLACSRSVSKEYIDKKLTKFFKRELKTDIFKIEVRLSAKEFKIIVNDDEYKTLTLSFGSSFEEVLKHISTKVHEYAKEIFKKESS